MKLGFITMLCGLGLLSACAVPPQISGQNSPQRSIAAQANLTPSPSQQIAKPYPHTRFFNKRNSLPSKVEKNRLVFQGQPRIKQGEVLIGRAQDGESFLRRVLAVESKPNETIVLTQQAHLNEAFEALDVSGAQLNTQTRPIQLAKKRFKLGFVNVESSLTVKPNFEDMRLRLEGRKALFLRLAPKLKLTWDVNTETQFLDLSPSALLTLKPIGQINFKTYRLPASIGPVPLTFYLRPSAALDWGNQGRGHLGLGGEFSGTVKAGLEMRATTSAKPDLKTFSSHSYSGKIDPPEIDFNGTVSTRVHVPKIRLESKIVNMVGPFIEVESFLDGEFKGSVKHQPKQKLVSGQAAAYLGLGLKAGLTPTTLFGKTLSKEISKEFFNKRIKTLYNKKMSYTLPK